MKALSVTLRPIKQLFLLLCFSVFQQTFAQENLPVCGTKDEDLPLKIRDQIKILPQLMENQRARKAGEEMRICRLMIDIDSETYLKYESDTAEIIQIVLENIETCSKVFEEEINTRLVVTQIKIFKDHETDPYYGEDNIFLLLNNLTYRNVANQNYDKHMYLYTKPVIGAGGVAFLGGRFNVSGLDKKQTILHELGHNFGSPHTHYCYWPGGPIDYCGSTEGDCYDKSLEMTIFGTLMSYCSAKRSFHPLCQAIMKIHAADNLAKIQALPEPVTLPGNITAAKGDFFSWPVSPAAKSYQISYALTDDFSGETIITTPFNGFYMLNLTLGEEYFVRIKAINSFGESSWSNVIQILIDPDQPDIPEILYPSLNAILPPLQPVTLYFSNVPGATGYQLQITDYLDPGFTSPIEAYVSENQFNYSTYNTGYRWRVKAIQGDKKGKWSKVSFYSGNPAPNLGLYLPFPDHRQAVSRTFPFFYRPISLFSDTRITVADNPEFANPIFLKNYSPYFEIIDVIENLPPNKNLFFKVQERNHNQNFYPDTYLIDYIIHFSTGSMNVPSGFTFMSRLDQTLFGQSNPKIALSNDYIWLAQSNYGFIKMDQKNLTYQLFNRSNTDGLLGIASINTSIHADKNLNIRILNNGNGNTYREVKLANENPLAEAEISKFNWDLFPQNFNAENKLYWTQIEIFRESNSNLTLLKSVSNNQSILNIQVFNNKAWVLIRNNTSYSTEIMIMDLDNPSIVEKIDFTTNSAIKNFIEQIEIQNDGKIWLRQTDTNTSKNSIAFFDGSNWSYFDAANSSFGYRITGMSLSPSGNVYILCTGSESQVYKYTNGVWYKVGSPLPFTNFEADLWVDKNESLWFSNIYGLSRLVTEPALPVTIVSFNADVESHSVTLNWKVSDEVNMAKYVVEHSKDGKTFAAIAETPASDNTLYSAIHRNPINGNNYYRLKSIETDNNFAFSKVISVNFSNGEDVVFYPNPTAGQIHIKLKPDLINQSGWIRIIAMDGKEIAKNKINRLRETELVDLSKIAAGSYMIRIENEFGTISKSVQLIR